MSKLHASTVKVKHLSASMKEDMFHLFCKYYENIHKSKFLKDLEAKEKVILLKDSSKIIRGFSSIVELEVYIGNKKVIGIFTGDTVIHDDFWGGIALSMEFFRNISRTKLKNPTTDVYWFLISKGYKTYLLLTNNFKNFYPRFDKEITAYHLEVINTLGEKLYGDLYDRQTNIIKAANKFDKLKADVAPITEIMISENPNIAFFSKMNPNWEQGDELCCIGRVDLGLAQKYLTRTFKKFLRRYT
jgi:hypothetical protein